MTSRKLWFAISLFFLGLPGISVLAQQEKTLTDAQNAYNQFDLETCQSICQRITSSSGMKMEDKVKAWLMLSQMDWGLFGNYELGVADLNKALPLKTMQSAVYLQRANIELDRKAYKAAAQYAGLAMAAAEHPQEKTDAAQLWAASIHDANLVLYTTRQALHIVELKRAAGLLRQILRTQPGRSYPTSLLAGISLMLADGPSLLSALKEYYFIENDTRVVKPLDVPFAVFSQILPGWNHSDLTPSNQKDLIKALAGVSFYEYAAALAKHFRSDGDKTDMGIGDILAFSEFIKAVGVVNRQFYPAIARGKKKYEDDYDSAINTAGKVLWKRLVPEDKPFNQDAFFDLIRSRFGADGYTGYTVNYYSLLLGLVVWDEQKEINQYGYKAKFRYISIDHLISQDFTSWYGITNVGGWGTDSSIIQVRKAYLSEPFIRLSWMIDSVERNKFLAHIEEDKVRDLVKCTKDPYGEPASLPLILKYNAAKQIFDSLSRSGLKEQALYTAFIAENLRLNVESTIFAHEGRHAIDQLFFKTEFDSLKNDERELRAKYSEVLFTSNTKLAFTGSIFGGDLSEETGHGKANKRFRVLIVDWMKQHQNEIKGLDASQPLIMQFDLLTDQQIRDIVLQADPLAAIPRK